MEFWKKILATLMSRTSRLCAGLFLLLFLIGPTPALTEEADGIDADDLEEVVDDDEADADLADLEPDEEELPVDEDPEDDAFADAEPLEELEEEGEETVAAQGDDVEELSEAGEEDLAAIEEDDLSDVGDDDEFEELETDSRDVATSEDGLEEVGDDDEAIEKLASSDDDFESLDDGDIEELSADSSSEERDITSGPNRVTDLQFRMAGANSRIEVSFSNRPRFSKTSNGALKQHIFVFENTKTPSKVQRAYDTSEFVSPVALFTILQLPNTTTSKLIVQLREDAAADAQVSGNKLVVTFPPPTVTPTTPDLSLANKGGSSGEKNLYANDGNFTGKRIQRLEIKNSKVEDVIRLIARSSGYNIVIGDDVKGNVGTLSLRDIPWDQAFTLVLQMHKLGYVRQGNVMRIGTLAALKLEKEEALANQQAAVKVAKLKTVLLPVSFADTASLIRQAKPFQSERGTISVDERTNTLIILDVEDSVQKITKLVRALDTQPPRVSISAKMVETSATWARTLGFMGTSFSYSQNGVNISPTINANGSPIGFSTSISATDLLGLNTIFSIGETEGKVRTLANPTITALNNKEASFNASRTIFVPGQPIVNVAGQPLTNPLQPIVTNLTLKVTPIISNDGSVSMVVDLVNQVPTGQGENTTIQGRTIKTDVLVQDGETAVIGGVFQTLTSEDRSGIPPLYKIPILGLLFGGGEREIESKTEIMVFITPKIINSDKAFKRNL